MWHAIIGALRFIGEILHILPREGRNGYRAFTDTEYTAAQKIIALQTDEIAAMGTRITAQLGQIKVLSDENERLRLERNAKGHAVANAEQKVNSLVYVIQTFGPPEMQVWIPKIVEESGQK